MTNPFDEPATFKISMSEVKPPLDLSLGSASGGGAAGGRAAGGRKAAAAAAPPAAALDGVDDPTKRLPSSFFCANATLTLEAGGRGELPVQFLPFQLGEYTATVLFSDAQARPRLGVKLRARPRARARVGVRLGLGS